MNEKNQEGRIWENAELRARLEDWKRKQRGKRSDDIKNIDKWLHSAIACEEGHSRMLDKSGAEAEILDKKKSEIEIYEIQKRIIKEVIKEKRIK